MNFRFGTKSHRACAAHREDFAAYLDGALSGLQMNALAEHMAQCTQCSADFDAMRNTHFALASLGKAASPVNLQARLRAAIAAERREEMHLPWTTRAGAWLRPLAMRTALATVVAVVMIGGVSTLLYATPSSVEANDEPVNTMTSPHFLYSEVPAQAIETGREVPILVDARIGEDGRVYDFNIVYGPTDAATTLRVQANLLSSRFQPATVFGMPVQGRVMMTYAGVSVRG